MDALHRHDGDDDGEDGDCHLEFLECGHGSVAHDCTDTVDKDGTTRLDHVGRIG